MVSTLTKLNEAGENVTHVNRRIGMIVTCYNVKETIQTVLESFSPSVLSRVDQIVALDNCSTDSTLSILRKLQSAGNELAQKLHVIANPTNLGYGGNVKAGIEYLTNNGFTHFMIIHGDNQCDSNKIAGTFLDEVEKDPSIDAILTNRFSSKESTAGYSWLRLFGNYFFNWATYFLTGFSMPDSGAAVCFYRLSIFSSIPYQFFTDFWQFNPQLNICLYSDPDLKLKVVPIVWWNSEAQSSINLFSYGLKLLGILVKYAFAHRVLGTSTHDYFADARSK